jgi:hypothetical protein
LEWRETIEAIDAGGARTPPELADQSLAAVAI